MTSTHTGRGGDELTDLALIALVALLTLSAVLRFAGNVAAFLTGASMPDGDPAAGLGVLSDPLHPGAQLGVDGLNPFVYWLAVVVMVAATVVLAGFGWRLVGHTRTPSAHPAGTQGLATTTDLARTASRRALVKRSALLRPSLQKATPDDVGYLLGHARGRELWASVEDAMLVLGPPRSGKGLHLVINAVLDAPGAVVTTSTRPDTLAVTLAARKKVGPVAVFDPQKLAGDVGGLRWSPIRGCEVPRRAMVRAAGLAKETGLGGKGVENGAFWENTTRCALQALLHAAALGNRSAKDLYVWSLSPAAAGDAVAILRGHPSAAQGWGEGLDGVLSGDSRSRESVWIGVRQGLACLADPDVLDAVSPRPDEQFDPESFLREKGTLYLLATGSGASASGAIVAALIEDLTETARRLAAVSPGQRLDPPLLLALDEIGNLTPLPSLRFLMADGGGTGITTIPVFQSLAQARDQWGPDSAAAIWDSSIVKVILGGTSSASDLRDLSALLGEKDEITDSWTIGFDGTRSVQRSLRRVPVMPPEKIRTLPFGQGLVLLRSAPPIVASLRPWTKRPDADRLAAGRAGVESGLRPRPGLAPAAFDDDTA